MQRMSKKEENNNKINIAGGEKIIFSLQGKDLDMKLSAYYLSSSLELM